MAKATKKSTAGKASSVLAQGTSSARTKSVAASALTQAQNPRTGRFVKIDRSTGTIVAHKRSRGAYSGVPIAGGRSKKK